MLLEISVLSCVIISQVRCMPRDCFNINASYRRHDSFKVWYWIQCYAGVLHVILSHKVYGSPEATGLNQAQRGDGSYPGTKQLLHGIPPSDTLCPTQAMLVSRVPWYTWPIYSVYILHHNHFRHLFLPGGFSNSQGNSAYWLDPANTNDVRELMLCNDVTGPFDQQDEQ